MWNRNRNYYYLWPVSQSQSESESESESQFQSALQSRVSPVSVAIIKQGVEMDLDGSKSGENSLTFQASVCHSSNAL